MAIGNCDNCDRQNVPVSNGEFCGCETTQCFICQGDAADPYGELDEVQIITAPGITVVSGNTEAIIDLFLPQQHNAHCMGYRWHQYMERAKRAEAAMREEGRRMIAEVNAAREAREQFQQAAE